MSKHIETGNHPIRYAVVERSGDNNNHWGPAISYHQVLTGAVIQLCKLCRESDDGQGPALALVVNAHGTSVPRARTRLNLAKARWPEYTGHMPWEAPF